MSLRERALEAQRRPGGDCGARKVVLALPDRLRKEAAELIDDLTITATSAATVLSEELEKAGKAGKCSDWVLQKHRRNNCTCLQTWKKK